MHRASGTADDLKDRAGDVVDDAKDAASDLKDKAGDVVDDVKDAAGDAVVYTCPHHPDVRASAPGKCPKCAMDLVPAKPAATP